MNKFKFEDFYKDKQKQDIEEEQEIQGKFSYIKEKNEIDKYILNKCDLFQGKNSFFYLKVSLDYNIFSKDKFKGLKTKEEFLETIDMIFDIFDFVYNNTGELDPNGLLKNIYSLLKKDDILNMLKVIKEKFKDPKNICDLNMFTNVSGLIYNARNLENLFEKVDVNDSRLKFFFGGRSEELKSETKDSHEADYNEFERLSEFWTKGIHNPQMFDQALEIFTLGLKYEPDVSYLERRIEDRFKQNMEKWLEKGSLFAKKGFPIHVFLTEDGFKSDHGNEIYNKDFDETKNGLDFLDSFGLQKDWLEYCFITPARYHNIQDYHDVVETLEGMPVSQIKKKPVTPEIAKHNKLVNIAKSIIYKMNEHGFFNQEKLINLMASLTSQNNELFPIFQVELKKYLERIYNENEDQTVSQYSVLKFEKLIYKLLPEYEADLYSNIMALAEKSENFRHYIINNLDIIKELTFLQNLVRKILKVDTQASFIFLQQDYNKYWDVLDLQELEEIAEEQINMQNDQDDDDFTCGVSEKDPYYGLPERYHNPDTIQLAIEIRRIFNNPDKIEKEYTHSAGELEKAKIAIKEIIEYVNKSYEEFIVKMKERKNIPIYDVQSLEDPQNVPFRILDFRRNILGFIAKYFAQRAKGEKTYVCESIIDYKHNLYLALGDAFASFLEVYEYDMPLYDKLFLEFDLFREIGREPTEVYLGRDGIYAYIGRRAQEKGRMAKKKDEYIEDLERGVIYLKPKYLVYPRHFRDEMDTTVIKKYLEDERISPDADPIFYDTGYKGSIPEQICEYIGINRDEIDDRIFLLSAEDARRRVAGVSENARSEIVEFIEHNAKYEDSASMIVKDEKTGRLRYAAQPFDPEEQLKFNFIKQAIARHYYIKELMRFQTVNFKKKEISKHFLIIDKSLEMHLPQAFFENTQEYIEEKGQILKKNESQDKYQQEDIRKLDLFGFGSVIVKKIEMEKLKTSQKKEFNILLAAQKLNLPTAKPLAFLEGKDDETPSFLVMEELEGVSGRKFFNYLQNLSQFSDEKKNEILEEIEKRHEMLAAQYRQAFSVDKPWRIKDTIIQINEETGEVISVVPIDWERVSKFNPGHPHSIKGFEKRF